jgi:hypothetical protein
VNGVFIIVVIIGIDVVYHIAKIFGLFGVFA